MNYADRTGGFGVLLVLLVDAAAYLIDHFTGGKVQGWAAGVVGAFTGAVRGCRRR